MGAGLSKVLMYNALPIQLCAVINSPSRGWGVFDVCPEEFFLKGQRSHLIVRDFRTPRHLSKDTQ